MKLCFFRAADGSEAVGFLQADRIVDLEAALQEAGGPAKPETTAGRLPRDLPGILRVGALDTEIVRAAARMAPDLPGLSRDAVTLLAPVPRPGKILGIGRNYGAHAAEGGLGRQEKPRIFLKASSSVIATGEPIPRPRGVTKLDWEVELAVVIGSKLKNASPTEALDGVAGFTILNDVSAREFQFDVQPPQTGFAKSMDGFTPMGPCLVTVDEIADLTGIELRCWVNGKLMQAGSTADMLFPVVDLLAYLSGFMTLEPGDVIATGTPAGVGHFRDPPVHLQPGDHIVMEIPQIGQLENRVIDAPGEDG